MARRSVLTALDIGSSKVVAVVAEVDVSGALAVLGVGQASPAGLRRGMIVDIEEASRAVVRAVTQAQQMSGVEAKTVLASLSGPHVLTAQNRGVVAIANPQREIGPEDVVRVLQAAQVINIPPDRRLLHVLPCQYLVDGYDGIVDPSGMAGNRLEVEATLVLAAASSIQNLGKVIARAGLQVQEVVLSALAAAEAVLLPAEKDLGVVLLDIGGGTTDLAVFQRGSLRLAAVLPVGGDYITSDLAIGLRIPLAAAEQVKKQHGGIRASPVPEGQEVEVPDFGGEHTKKVSRQLLAAIVEARVKEILGLVRQKLAEATDFYMLPGGVVLTGGTAALAGLAQLAGEILQMPVRIGRPQGLEGMADLVQGPEYATAVGLLLYGARSLGRAEAAGGEDVLLGGWLSRLWAWVRDSF
ncbi:MAG: cell division protein FtsA [Clostridia bacterium]|nr:cell division protein FtsA [Clostridia bacterium]